MPESVRNRGFFYEHSEGVKRRNQLHPSSYGSPAGEVRALSLSLHHISRKYGKTGEIYAPGINTKRGLSPGRRRRRLLSRKRCGNGVVGGGSPPKRARPGNYIPIKISPPGRLFRRSKCSNALEGRLSRVMLCFLF